MKEQLNTPESLYSIKSGLVGSNGYSLLCDFFSLHL